MTMPAITRRHVTECLHQAEADIRRLGVRRIALFGPIVRGEARSDSDVDLVVEFYPDQKSFDQFLDLGELLETRLGRPVELVTTEALSPFLGPRILAEAQDVLRAA